MMTEEKAARWYADPFAGPSMIYDAEQSLRYEHGYNGFKLGLLQAVRNRDAGAVTRYLNK